MKPMRLSPPDALALVGDVIDDDVVADLVRRGVEDPAGIQAGKLVDETAAMPAQRIQTVG